MTTLDNAFMDSEQSKLNQLLNKLTPQQLSAIEAWLVRNIPSKDSSNSLNINILSNLELSKLAEKIEKMLELNVNSKVPAGPKRAHIKTFARPDIMGEHKAAAFEKKLKEFMDDSAEERERYASRRPSGR